METPLFIVFEGLDGSGTSTQANLLTDHYRRSERQVFLTTEPTSGPIGQQIRSAFSGRLRFSAIPETFDRQMAYLFAADRFDHLHNEIDGVLHKLQAGISVISTRYFFSSFAYHCNTDEDFKQVALLNSAFPNPDLTIYVDVPVETSVERLSKRSTLETYENEKKLRAVRANYDRIFADYKGLLLRVDGTKPADAIHQEIVATIDHYTGAFA
ncbi:dTMP kinase [Rhizobium leguminosarum]|uniref:dTMP kinase n=1 Tax=Rhizobium leguminosarum TaxID=384 RepID=UPI001C96EFFA|nr:dTMP kinase [Rhizobium leguminosarum]MBY5367396.1 dTMP kinase [Rhizobium leguminosarum]MBY5449958.1 dTMP kinase [Rhizobium leguminosarum]